MPLDAVIRAVLATPAPRKALRALLKLQWRAIQRQRTERKAKP